MEHKLFQRFRDEFRTFNSNHPGLTLYLTPVEAWYLMSQLQLACRHPKNNGGSRRYAESLALTLQLEIARTPALATVASRGWNPLYDVTTSSSN